MRLPEFPIEGGCLCGAVRYRMTAGPLTVYRCHCKDCQRHSGSTHSMSMFVSREHVELLSGRPTFWDKPADSGRVVRMFGCETCGTRLWNEPQSSPAMLVLKPGTLDDLHWARPVGNIWTNSRVPWMVIDETEVNFPGQPADRQPLFDAWSSALERHADEGAGTSDQR